MIDDEDIPTTVDATGLTPQQVRDLEVLIHLMRDVTNPNGRRRTWQIMYPDFPDPTVDHLDREKWEDD